ncbi:hypothetical protein [Streptomyces sp. NPDC048295]|uniref:hypothetical protein n=1 Tax=Streptomyces sp. NPDC048295 TaxID=3154617 RepID=UPI00344ADD56
MKMTSAMAAAAVGAVLVAGPVPDASAQRYWNKKVRCEQSDPEGRVIPTRYGNGDLGWNHFSGKHNIRKCRVVDATLAGKVDKQGGGRLEYYGVARNGARFVNVVVIVQYARRTTDGEYDAGKGKEIGVVTAYCRGVNKCPDWINQ